MSEIAGDAAQPEGETGGSPAPETATVTAETEQPTSPEEGKQADHPGDETPGEEGEGKKNWPSKRISQLTQRAKDAEERAERAEQSARDAEARAKWYEQNSPQGQSADDPYPTLESVGFDEVKLQEAVAGWHQRQGVRNANEALLNQQNAQAGIEKQNAATARKEAFGAKCDAYAEENADFYDVTRNPQLPINQVMLSAAMMSESGPAMLYHLGKNPQEAQRIAGLHPMVQLMELGSLSKSLSQVVAPNLSKAPAPPSPVGNTGVSEKSPDQETSDEYAARRRKERGWA